MLDSISCNLDPFIIAGKIYEPIPWGKERRFRRVPGRPSCPDCGTPPGAVHHHGCDVEECPVCRGQAIGCSCDERGEWDHPAPRPHGAMRRCAMHPQRGAHPQRGTPAPRGRPM